MCNNIPMMTHCTCFIKVFNKPRNDILVHPFWVGLKFMNEYEKLNMTLPAKILVHAVFEKFCRNQKQTFESDLISLSIPAEL
jgi:hypothetical protein